MGHVKATGQARMRCGKQVAAALAGAWRNSPPPLHLSNNALAEVTPLLLRLGVGGLVWRRVRHSDLGACRAGLKLRQAYRLHTLQAAIHHQQVKQAIKLLREADVEALLGKGWAVARLYPEPGLRPYGDIDLCVGPEQHAAAVAAMRAPGGPEARVDLHRGFRTLDRSWDELYDRSELVPLGEVGIRILGAEDHLRLLCLHMLEHGVWRPLWLCDLGAVLETLPSDFDWEYCLSGNRRRSEWVACALGLAHQLLGARLEEVPPPWRARHLPRWLIPSVLRQWEREEHYMHTPSMAFALRHPAHLLKALRLRWPNPIEATVGLGGPFNDLPRLPFQLGQCLSITAQFAAQLVGSLRKQR